MRNVARVSTLTVVEPAAPRPRRGIAAAGLVAGVALAIVGGWQLEREIQRHRELDPLVRDGGWQRAVVRDGVTVVAEHAEKAADRIGDAGALRDGAAVLGSLATATADPVLLSELRRRSLLMALRSLGRSPGSARAHLLAGAALADAGEGGATLARAAAHLGRAAALDPNSVTLRKQLGVVALSRQRPEEAATHFRVALSADPAAARIIYETMALFDTPLSAADVTPHTVAAQSALGAWLEDEGDVAGARQALVTSLVLADTSEPAGGEASRGAYARLQGHLFGQHDWRAMQELASRRLQERRHADPDDRARLHYHRGYAALRTGRLAAAVDDLTTAVTLDPDHLASRDALARTLASMERHVEAAETWREALTRPRLVRRDTRLVTRMRLSRARSLLAVTRPGPAVDELREVLRSDPSNVEARRLLEELGL